MTYCVALRLQDGFVMLSDTRTNAGVDNISTFGKMHRFNVPGDRVIVLLTSGNLGITQTVVTMLNEGFERDGKICTLYDVPSLFKAAQLVGAAIRHVYETDGPVLKAQGINFDVAILLGGQIQGRPVRLFQIYAAGNFIEATEDTPFLQIGEHKYGKPILDRAVSYRMDLQDAVKLVLISMDSTLRSNLTVGMPIDLLIYRAATMQVELERRITENDPYFRMISERWSEALRDAYRALPRPEWAP
jgi:putative proteasome-type protease